MHKNLDQERAAFAWECVKENLRDEKYKNLAKSAPALIMNNGLMHTLAFFKSKSKDHHCILLNNIIDWLNKKNGIGQKYQDVMKELCNSNKRDTCRQATEETMHLLRWIRQFADTGGD